MSRNDPHTIPPELLLKAYRAGIFPMADSRDDPDVFWVEPKMRAILPLDGFHMSRSLARTLRRGRFSVTCNAAFESVIDACAAPRPDAEESWISTRIRESYIGLHEHGHAHSIECWRDGRLVGGLYGVGFARVFCGESMFSREADASKVALAWLVASLRRVGAELLDCQFTTAHLTSMGAVEIPQREYLQLLSQAQRPYSPGESAVALALAEELGDGLATGAGAAAPLGAPLGLPAGFAALRSSAFGASSPGNVIAQSFTHTS
ncbi:leucyl/phenylalanyl-tRNA--protein transferase [Novosphingobium sp. CECT 9465]|uniref:leucyl/phenylalanyl-tRNA--protein transferase n=1 Tax=Novosphingobium sp. CECT 9465 TaxID=2829794 RepID=UPI001E5AD606|nr:leucyl/phenylalanyl-tRNA--protein transferase [Novosphingobium sp. CECT 9465]CAH0496122.1 Leucyl/phenylalanyl-tRNA--protein transferase [Novosphingobium sp. CECT 9465]